jgi:hypothetical protein
MKSSLIVLPVIAALISGCSVPSPSRVATKTVSFAGSVATKTTVAAVKTSGHIVATTTKAVVHTSGSIVKTAVTTPMIIFKDTATGIVRQVPYSEGLRLYAASQTAQFQMGLQSFQLLRNGTPVLTSAWTKVKAGTHSDPVLHPGDVVQVTRVLKPKTVSKRSRV